MLTVRSKKHPVDFALVAMVVTVAAGLVGPVDRAAADPPFPVCQLSTTIGPATGGTEVLIDADAGLEVTSVKFGGVEAQGFTVLNYSQVVATSPAHAVGEVAVTLTTPEGTSGPCVPDPPGSARDGRFHFVNPTGGSWSKGGQIHLGEPTATRLQDGTVLFVGRFDQYGEQVLSRAALYDPSKHAYHEVGSPMNVPRFDAKAALLPSGKLLVAGGIGATFDNLNSSEIYDPATGTWTLTANELAHGAQSATPLADGKVLAIGREHAGAGGEAEVSSELYDPATDLWKTCPPPATPSADCPGKLNQPRHSYAITRLNDGTVLVAQGKATSPPYGAQIPQASSELYDPATGRWSSCEESVAHAGCPGPLGIQGFQSKAVTLKDGKALVIGGQIADGNRSSGVQEYDPASGRWAPTGPLLGARLNHTATVLADGQVLVTGGFGSSELYPQEASELYDPASRRWHVAAFQLFQSAQQQTATLLANGQVLIAGSGQPQSQLFTLDRRAGSPATQLRTNVPPAGVPAFPACPATAANVIRGSAAENAIVGSPRADRIFAGGGDDLVKALAGNDCVDLGDGADRGEGGPGADLMRGEAGDDRVEGSSGADRIAGGSGADRVEGGSGNDRLSGNAGRDRMAGGSGRDRISGNSGRDRLSGGSGADRISGGSGADRISARDGRRDRIACGRGGDVVTVDRIDRVARDCERVVRRK